MKKLYFFCTICLLASFTAQAQNQFFVDNGASVTVQNGANLWVFGGVLATGATSQIVNNGIIYVEAGAAGGDWTNNSNAGLLSGTGEVVVGVNTNQTITGTFPTTFFNLTLMSSTVAGSNSGVTVDDPVVTQKILSQNIYVGANSDATNLITPPTNVTGVLALNNEVLNTQTFVCSVVNPATTAVTRTGVVTQPYNNSTTQGMVISTGAGRLARNTSLLGIYLFPVGSLTGTARFRPVEMITAGVTANKGYAVRMENSNPTVLGTTLDTDPGEELFSINQAYYHIINHTLPTPDNSAIRIHHDFTADNVCDPNFVTISELDNIVPTWQNQTPTISTTVNASPTLSFTQDVVYTGTYVTENFALAGWWNTVTPYIGGTPACTFPVTNLKLLAKGNKEVIDLDWSTDVEANVKGFYLERSADGSSFNDIAYRTSSGNSSSTRHYYHTDGDVVKNQTYFYRVREIGRDGAFSYSNIAEAILINGGLGWGIEIYPNPIQNQAQVVFNMTEDNTIKLMVYNALGQNILTESYMLKTGKQTMVLDTQKLSKGMYNWVFTDNKGNVLTQKITKID